MFGAPPSRHGNSRETEPDPGYEFTRLDELLPHPVYARMNWICVLNPSYETFEQVKPLLAEAYAVAVSKYAKRVRRR
jgi:hypothetical protein